LDAIDRNESSDQSERELLLEVTAPARPHRSARTAPGAPRPSLPPSV
jgi:hypothetical protein